MIIIYGIFAIALVGFCIQAVVETVAKENLQTRLKTDPEFARQHNRKLDMDSMNCRMRNWQRVEYDADDIDFS